MDPREILTQAAAAPAGIEVEFASAKALTSFRARLYRVRARDQAKLDKALTRHGSPFTIGSAAAIEARTGWEGLTFRQSSATVLWIGPASEGNLGIVAVRGVVT